LDVTVAEETLFSLGAYAKISIAYDVSEVIRLDPSPALTEGSELRTQSVALPFRKDYDAIPGNDPLSWPARFDPSRLILLAAFIDGVRVGGAAVLTETSLMDHGDSPADVATLLDLRVDPAFRGRRVASVLLSEAERVAWGRGARLLEVETQDINVPACRLYARRGFRLCAVNRDAYPSLPEEVQLLWVKRIARI
jgi:GNAT superfamily N-acetyltransferase